MPKINAPETSWTEKTQIELRRERAIEFRNLRRIGANANEFWLARLIRKLMGN